MTEVYLKLKKSSYATIFLISLFSFLIFYIPNNFFFDIDALIYISYFIRQFIDSFIPVFSAAVLFLSDTEKPVYKSILPALKLALPRLVYVIPYYYLYYMAEGFDSFESIAFLSIHAVFLLIVFTLEIWLYSLLARFALKRRARVHGYEIDFEEERSVFDLASPLSFALFTLPLARFVYDLIQEIYSAVSYLVEYAGSYRPGEIVFMLGKFVFVLLSLLLSHLLVHFFKRRAKTAYQRECLTEEELAKDE